MNEWEKGGEKNNSKKRNKKRERQTEIKKKLLDSGERVRRSQLQREREMFRVNKWLW